MDENKTNCRSLFVFKLKIWTSFYRLCFFEREFLFANNTNDDNESFDININDNNNNNNNNLLNINKLRRHLSIDPNREFEKIDTILERTYKIRRFMWKALKHELHVNNKLRNKLMENILKDALSDDNFIDSKGNLVQDFSVPINEESLVQFVENIDRGNLARIIYNLREFILSHDKDFTNNYITEEETKFTALLKPFNVVDDGNLNSNLWLFYNPQNLPHNINSILFGKTRNNNQEQRSECKLFDELFSFQDNLSECEKFLFDEDAKKHQLYRKLFDDVFAIIDYRYGEENGRYNTEIPTMLEFIKKFPDYKTFKVYNLNNNTNEYDDNNPNTKDSNSLKDTVGLKYYDKNSIIRYFRVSQNNLVNSTIANRLYEEPIDLKKQYNIYYKLRFGLDFFYNKAALQILRNRYLLLREPIQFGMLRFARLLSRDHSDSNNNPILPQRAEVFTLNSDGNMKFKVSENILLYNMMARGILAISSILSVSEYTRKNANKNNNIIRPGEACRLVVAKDNYNEDLVIQLNEIATLVSLGVGVGYGVSNLPLNGKLPNETGQLVIRSDFKRILVSLNNKSGINMFERRPKIAIYLHVHCDTINEALYTRNINNIDRTENINVAVMIPHYFMRCVEKCYNWYLFPGDLVYTEPCGKKISLNNLRGNEYVYYYKLFVEKKLYTRQVSATELFIKIASNICTSGNPYVIFSDNVNDYNNLREVGVIKTLNLCAEIANYSDSEKSSSCTLICVNLASFKEFTNDFFALILSEIIEVYEFKNFNKLCVNSTKIFENINELTSNEHLSMSNYSTYAFACSFVASICLNNVLRDNRKDREIGINPMGIYDLLLATKDIKRLLPISALISEAMYMGGIEGSIWYNRAYEVRCNYFDKSQFRFGKTQYHLRNEKSSAYKIPTQLNWKPTRKEMLLGMANSMITSQAPTATVSILMGVNESVCLPLDWQVCRENENGRSGEFYYGYAYLLLNDKTRELLETLTVSEIETNTEIETTSITPSDVITAYYEYVKSTMLSKIKRLNCQYLQCQDMKNKRKLQKIINYLTWFYDFDPTRNMPEHAHCSYPKNFKMTDIELKLQSDMYRVTAPFVDHSQSTTLYFALDPEYVIQALWYAFASNLKTALYYANPFILQPSLNIGRHGKSILSNRFKDRQLDKKSSQTPMPNMSLTKVSDTSLPWLSLTATTKRLSNLSIDQLRSSPRANSSQITSTNTSLLNQKKIHARAKRILKQMKQDKKLPILDSVQDNYDDDKIVVDVYPNKKYCPRRINFQNAKSNNCDACSM